MPWTSALPPSSDTQVVWRAVRGAGHEVFLFGGGEIIEGNDVRAILQWYVHGVGLRGDAPGATPRPSPTYRPSDGVATADEVAAAALTDVFVLDYFRYLRGDGSGNGPIVQDPRLGMPVCVTGLHKPYTLDVWIVPVLDRTNAIVSLVAVSDRDGSEQAIQSRTWSGAFPHVSEADAKRAGGSPADPAISAQLGRAESYYIPPGGATSAAWLVTRLCGCRSSSPKRARSSPRRNSASAHRLTSVRRRTHLRHRGPSGSAPHVAGTAPSVRGAVLT